MFPAHLPGWAVWGAVAGLLSFFVFGYLLSGRPFVRTPIDVPVWLLLLLLPLALLVTPDRNVTLAHVLKVIGSTALFYGVVGFLDENPRFDLVVLGIGVAGLVLAPVVLLGTRWLPIKFPWLPVDLYELLPRAVRPFWNPLGFHSNIAGSTLAMLLPVPTAYLFFGRRRWLRLGAFFEAGVIGAVLLFTQSRGAIVALLAGLTVMLIVHDKRWLVAGVLVTLLSAFILQAAEENDPQASDSALAAQHLAHTAQGRQEMWSSGLLALQDFPFTGIGFGTALQVLPLLYPGSSIFIQADLEHVHNLYLQAGVDSGFPGLIATLAFLMGLLHVTWRAARRARGTGLEPLASAMLGVVVVFAVHGLTDNPTFYKAHYVAWTLFGVAIAVGSQLLRDEGPVTLETPSRPT